MGMAFGQKESAGSKLQGYLSIATIIDARILTSGTPVTFVTMKNERLLTQRHGEHRDVACGSVRLSVNSVPCVFQTLKAMNLFASRDYSDSDRAVPFCILRAGFAGEAFGHVHLESLMSQDRVKMTFGQQVTLP
jgi:hypothetical protein